MSKPPSQSLDHYVNIYSTKAYATHVFDSSAEELVDQALKRMQDAGVELIEWVALLHRRMGVPVLIKNYPYLVPDEQLEQAHKIITEEVCLPFSRPPPLMLRTSGDFYRKARMYRITRETHVAFAQHLVIYPASFASYDPLDLSPSPRLTSLRNPTCATVLVPSQPAVYASILRLIKSYKQYDPARNVLKSDLEQLIDYNLYELDCGYVDTDDEDLCEELQLDRRVEDAVRLVEEWRQTDQLRDDEGWIGDALVKVVSGAWSIDDLPYRK